MVGFDPSTQTHNVQHTPVLEYSPSPAQWIEEYQIHLNPTYPLNVLHQNGIGEVDAKSNPVSYIEELDLQERL